MLGSAGVLIYLGYGMWNSALEIAALEEEIHASTYQRYDLGVDDNLAVGDHDDRCPPEGRKEGSRGGDETSTQRKSSRVKSKTVRSDFDARVVDDDLDEPLE